MTTIPHPAVVRPQGRPDAAESRRRELVFIEQVVDGADFLTAARVARMQPERTLRFLSTPEMRQLLRQLDPPV